MKNLPIRRAQFNTADFAAWLASEGAEICKPTNPYEVIRYRAYVEAGGKAATHIVYAKESGLLTFTGSTRKHYIQFTLGGQMYPQAATIRAPETRAAPPSDSIFTKPETPSKGDRRRQKLIARDGGDCWFCGQVLGDDCTIEHLVARGQGGFDKLANLALAHRACNQAAGDMPLVKKIALRAEMRASTPKPSEAFRVSRKVEG